MRPLFVQGFLGIAGRLIDGYRAGFHATELKQNSEMRAIQNLNRTETYGRNYTPA